MRVPGMTVALASLVLLTFGAGAAQPVSPLVQFHESPDHTTLLFAECWSGPHVSPNRVH